MDDLLLSTLLDMGFSAADCQMAHNLGCSTAEQAINFLTSDQHVNSNIPTSGVLHLSAAPTSGSNTSNLPNSASNIESESFSNVVHSRYSESRGAQKLIEEKKAKMLHDEVLQEKKLKQVDRDSILKEVEADKKSRQERYNLVEDASKQTQQSTSDETIQDEDSRLKSRYSKKMKDEAKFRSKNADQMAEKVRKEREMQNAARLEALRRIEEDRLSKLKKKDVINVEPCSSEIDKKVENTVQTTNEFVNIRFRLPSGFTIVEKFLPGALVAVVFDFVESCVKSKAFSLTETFPPFLEISSDKSNQTIRSLNLGNNVSLAVKMAKLVEVSKHDIIPPDQVMEQNQSPAENISDLSSGDDLSEVPYHVLREEEEMEQDEVNAEENNEDEENNASDEDEQNLDEAGAQQGPENVARNPAVFGRDMRPFQQYNISQRLGSESGSNEQEILGEVIEAAEVENVETPEIRRQRFLEAAQSRLVSQADSMRGIKTQSSLKYSCLTLRTLVSEFVVKSFLEQKVDVSMLDTTSAELVVDLLKQKKLLSGKTFHPFIASGITTLDLSGYPYLTNELVRAISFCSLTKLNVKSGENLTDSALNHIAKVPNLRSLVISHCGNFTSGAMCKLLECLPDLELFEAAGTKLNSDSFSVLVEKGFVMRNTIVLDVSETCVKSAESVVALFPNVVSLLLNGTPIPSIGAVRDLKKLRRLSVANCNIQDVLALKDCGFLESLDITNSCKESDLDDVFSYFSHMKYFRIPLRSGFKDRHLLAMSKMRLVDLDISNCSQITAAGFESFFKQLAMDKEPCVKSLVLFNTNLSSSCIPLISKLSSLDELNLDYTKIADSDVKNIQNLTLLTTLSLVGNNLTDKMFADCALDHGTMVFSSLVSLAKLNLSRNAGLTNFGLKRLKHASVEVLSLMQTGVTNAVEEVMRKNMPQLKIVKY